MKYNYPYPINPQTEEECKIVLSYLFESQDEIIIYSEIFVRLEAMEFNSIQSLGIHQSLYEYDLVKDEKDTLQLNFDAQISPEEIEVIEDMRTSACTTTFRNDLYVSRFEGKLSNYSSVGTTRAQAINRLFYWIRSLVK